MGKLGSSSLQPSEQGVGNFREAERTCSPAWMRMDKTGTETPLPTPHMKGVSASFGNCLCPTNLETFVCR